MKRNVLIIILAGVSVVVSVAIGAMLMTGQNQNPTETAEHKHVAPPPPNVRPTAPAPTVRMPAFFRTAPSAGSLPPTLPPENFAGQTREAYQAAREIPQTIAQLPCYCYCDEERGHKSLHSCFEDDHAASCGVCIREALLAYRLEKEQGLTPLQIRERIVGMFGPRG